MVVDMDEIDRKIISKLHDNGRTTFEELGKIIKYSSMGAKKRTDKLLKSETIKISAQLNIKHLDLCSAVVLIETDSSETTQRLLKRFRECPRVVNIFTTVGGYNIVALIVAENLKTLESISMEKCSIRSEKGIRRSEFFPIGEIHYTPFLSIRESLTHKGLPTPPCNVECQTCERFRSEECVGCPATEDYRGQL